MRNILKITILLLIFSFLFFISNVKASSINMDLFDSSENENTSDTSYDDTLYDGGTSSDYEYDEDALYANDDLLDESDYTIGTSQTSAPSSVSVNSTNDNEFFTIENILSIIIIVIGIILIFLAIAILVRAR